METCENREWLQTIKSHNSSSMLWHDYFINSLGLIITKEDNANEINEVFDANMIDGVDVMLQNV